MMLSSHDFRKKALNIGIAMKNKFGKDILYQKKLIWIKYLTSTSDT